MGLFGQLGNGATTMPNPTPVTIDLGGIPTQVDGGASWTCAIVSSEVKCWGKLNFDRFQYLSTFSRPTTVLLGASGTPKKLAGGRQHVCVIAGSELLCWGANDKGQLGQGTAGAAYDSPIPLQVGISGQFTDVAAGTEHTCAISSSELYCWGENTQGQLGINSYDQQNLPAKVSLGCTPSKVDAGGSHTCVVCTDGQLKCWGRNFYGQIGIGASNSKYWSPQTIRSGVDTVSVATEATCIRTGTGDAMCVGQNFYGAIGTGSLVPENYYSYVNVASLGSKVQTITFNGKTPCAITDSGIAFCWGQNSYGAIGNPYVTELKNPSVVVLWV